eukprot:jgi/Galph1/5320/GphlegSOOS_G3921.1
MNTLKVLLETGIQYQKQPFILKIFENTVHWEPCVVNKNLVSVSLPVSSIKAQMVSAKGSKQSLIKLTTVENSNSYILEFTKEGKPDFETRDKVKDIISKQLAISRVNIESALNTQQEENRQEYKESVSPEEAKRRLEILRKYSYVQKLHMSLVGSGMIPDGQFWKGIHYRFQDSTLKDGEQDSNTAVTQKKGLVSEVLTDISPVEEKGKTVKYRLTPEIIHQIFTEQPAVYLAYQNYVPQKMSEQQFWTNYFQSRYVHQRNSKDTTEPQEDLFSPFEAKVQDGKALKDIKANQIESKIYSSLEDQDIASRQYLDDYEKKQDANSENTFMALMQRLNRHSSLVMESSLPSSWQPDEYYQQHPFPELEGTQSENKHFLSIQQPPYHFPSRRHSSQLFHRDWKHLVSHLRIEELNLELAIPTRQTSQKVLEELFMND